MILHVYSVCFWHFLTYMFAEFLGPIEGSARSTGAAVPVSKKRSNGNLDSAAPSKSERLNSPNTSNWEPDVRMLLSTSQWLKVDDKKTKYLCL